MLSHQHEVIEIVDDEVAVEKVNPGVNSTKFPFLHSILQRKYENKLKLDLPKISESNQMQLSPLKSEKQAQQICNLVKAETHLSPNLPQEINQLNISSNVEQSIPQQEKELAQAVQLVQIDEKQGKEERQLENYSKEDHNLHEKQQQLDQANIKKKSKGKSLPDLLTVEVCLDPIRPPADLLSPCFSQDESPVNKPSSPKNSLLVIQGENIFPPVQRIQAYNPYAFNDVISADKLRQNKMSIVQKYLSLENSQGNYSSPQPQVQLLVSESQNLPNQQAQHQPIANKPQSISILQEKANYQIPQHSQNIEIEVFAQSAAPMAEEIQQIQRQQPLQYLNKISNQIPIDNIASNNLQQANIQNSTEQKVVIAEILQQNAVNASIESSNHFTTQQQTKKIGACVDQLDIIKKKIVQILPDLDRSSIQSLGEEELLYIYNNVKGSKSNSLQSENPQLQVHQSKEAILTDNKAIQNNQNRQQIVEKIHQHNEDVSEAHPFSTLRDLDEQSLRIEMIKNIPEAKESIIGMNESQLRDLLNEAIAQIQKQTNKEQYSAANSRKNNQTLNNNTSAMKISHHQPSIQEMRTYLIKLAPKWQKEIEEINQHFIEELYRQSSDKGTSKSVPKVSEIEHSIIQKMCLQKMPNLSAEIEKMSKEQLTKIYDGLIAKLNSPSKSPSKPNPQISKPVDNKVNPETPKSIPIQKSPKQPQPSLKRNYETMISTNPKISISDGKKKKIQYRAKLLRTFPDLKENIMKIGDHQIEKIFKESIEPHYAKKMQKSDEVKPIIVLPDKKFVPELVANQKEQMSGNCEQSASKAQSSLIKNQPRIVQLQSEGGRKKSRTVVLIHTEDIDEDLDKRQKSRKIGQFSEKKWNCQCLNTVTVIDLVRKLTELIDKKNE